MIWLHALWVFIAGMLQPVQSGMNAELSRHAAAPLTAATWNMLIGFVVVALICVISGAPVPGVSLLRSAPIWSLWGGLCGAVIVFTMLFNAPILGAVLLLSCFLLGQLTSSSLLDQFGTLGFPKRPITEQRLVGLAFVVVGVALLLRTR
ncbi:MAG: hypothetical protein CMJ28_00680 [Phycisphaerae bacterium]|nr:hypothetical protein [Phycisphaerae bacterium]